MFAVNFTSPERLWWALVLVLPLAIHLWRRRYQRVVAWSAMRFLQAAQQQVQQRVRLRRLWLLLLRVAMLGLLIFAIADPSTDYSQFPQYLRGSTGTHHVLLLDTSYSMGAVGESTSAFELARQQAIKYVQQLPQGDVISIVTISSRDRPLIEQPVFDRQEIIAELAALELTNRSGEALNAITLAAELAERSRVAMRVIVMTR
ncbi:MAG: BatA domain-containing protein [Planctomycetes bacterium]|nr:BatA domain-containing protein [Planctomycetota bacterium]